MSSTQGFTPEQKAALLGIVIGKVECAGSAVQKVLEGDPSAILTDTEIKKVQEALELVTQVGLRLLDNVLQTGAPSSD